ncbi:MAG: hypothetical protein E7621_06980 [Ruminococcaceae bacterium]|nr:hypothetical protein [Oscillospiraceae bacterium]
MGFKLILAGLVFFFNPCINLVDILPDFIGCILISAGLCKLADIEDRFAYARKIINYLIPIYIGKLLLSFMLTARWKDGLLPFTFAYSVGEIILMIVFSVSLFGAIENMANLHDGEKHLTASGNLCKVSIIFAVIKNILAFIPEAFVLVRQDPDLNLSYNARPSQTLLQAKPFVILFFTLVVLVAGIYFLSENIKFFGAISKDRKFIKNLSDIYSERILENEKLMNRRAFFKFIVFMIIGSLVLLDLVVDAVNILPDVFSYSVMLWGMFSLGNRIELKDKRRITALFIPLCVISVISAGVRIWLDMGVNYMMGYESYLVSRNILIENGSAIALGTVLSAAEGALAVVFIGYILRSANKFYKEKTGAGYSSKYTVVSATLVAISGVFSYITPIVKAYCYGRYIDNTVKNMAFKTFSDNWELAQGYANIALIISVALLVHSVIKINRKADIEL